MTAKSGHNLGISGTLPRSQKQSTLAGRWYSRALVLVCAAAAVITPLAAQERFGSFLGTVTDPSGAVVEGATVTLTSKETNLPRTTTTNGSGAYVFRQLEPGRYSFTFEKTGFTRSQVADALLTLGQELTVNMALQVGGSTQTVEITDAAPLIDTTGVTRSNNITAEEFNALPKGRSFQSIAQFTPSVNTGQIEGGFQINGASGAENAFFVDGVTTNSVIDGRSRENAAFEFLQEVQVKTGGIDAQYGGATGGVISAVTRSGGNQFHGEAHYYLGSNSFSSNSVQRLYLADQFGAGKNPTFVQDPKQQNNLHEVGGSLGGRLIKDKLFFFSSYSPQLVRRSNNYLFSNGTEADTLKSNQNNEQLFNKVTIVPVSRLRVNLSWLWTPTRTEGILPAYNGATPGAVITSRASSQALKTQGWTQPQSNYTGQIDYTVNPTTVLTIRGGRFWDNFRTWGIPNFSSITVQTAANGTVPGLAEPYASAQAGFSNTPRTQQTFYDITTRTFAQLDGSKYVGNFFGSHDIQAGYGITKAVNNVNVSYPGGGYVYLYFNTPYQGKTGPYGHYEVYNIGTKGTTGGTETNLYFQDHWRIHKRVSLSLGLRAENEHIPSFRRATKEEAFSFGFKDKLSPRLGLSWDVKGDGRMKVYGSYSRLYGNVPYETSRGSFGGDIYTVFYHALDTTNVASLSGTNIPGANLWPTGEYRDRRVPNFNTVDPNIMPMSTDLFNAGFEYQIGSSMVARVNYTGNHLVRTIEDLGVLDAAGNEVYQFVNPGEGIAKKFNPSGLTPVFDTPRPQRDYDALEVSLTRRFSRGFFGQASYVASRLYGNYAGLGNSDEILTPTSGSSSGTTQQSGGSISRPGTTGSRAWDLDEILFDAKGQIIYGKLATDRPNVFKLYGDYTKNWGKVGATNFGVFFLAENGTPVTTAVDTVNGIQVFVNGRGDLGRTPFLNQTDLVVGHEVKLGEHKTVRLEFNMLNLFDQKTARHIFNQINRGANTSNAPNAAIDLSKTNLQKGYDYNALIKGLVTATNDPYDPRFGLPDLFNPGFSGRLGLKFIF